VFSNGKPCKALSQDVFELEDGCDLVYIDTPYLNRKGAGVDYLGFYHFLEGLANYEKWHTMIDYRTKHRRLRDQRSVWTDKTRITSAFDRLFRRFRDRILVVSYRSDGIPAIGELKQMLLKHKPHVREERREGYKYVLSNNCTDEVLLIGS
jgi:DNA adenine methylase/adenine-specific DNA-methyltransferase